MARRNSNEDFVPETLAQGLIDIMTAPSQSPALLHRGARRANNRLAVALAVTAAHILTWAMFAPVIRYQGLQGVQDYSLLGGISALMRGGDLFIGIVLLVFSVFFPYAKLALVTAAAWSGGWTGWMERHVRQLGPLSLLDVFVLAVIIVLLRLHDILEASARYGIVLFCIAVLLSLAAAHFVAVRQEEKRDMRPEISKY